MADISISYKGSEIASMSASGTKTLETSGKYCEDDIEITYTKPSNEPSQVDQKDVNFYDYDGTLLYSYSKSNFANLTELPANPTHNGLTAQGWNWTLSDAKTYVTSYGGLNIGQLYVTSDGKTKIYIELSPKRLSPSLGIGINGTADVDWGDESTHSTITGTSTTTVKYASHTYSNPGKYTIILSITGTANFFGPNNNSTGTYLLCKQGTTGRVNSCYQNAIKKIEIGNNITIGAQAFWYCYSLSTITIPNSITSFGNQSFLNCSSLQFIVIPNNAELGTYMFRYNYTLQNISISKNSTAKTYMFQYCNSLEFIYLSSETTGINNALFGYCESLSCIHIPQTTTAIGTGSFGQCTSLKEIHFYSTTPPTVSASSAWTSIPSDCVIYVPKGYLSTYTGTTNYPSSSTYSYVEE